MIADYFYYDGISSKVYDLIIASFSGSEDGTQEMGNVEITTIKAPRSNNFLRANATYNQALQMTFSIVKMNCNDAKDIFFSEREIAFISRWLARKDYKPLKFVQEGWENIHYNAILKVDQHMSGGQCVGFDITATCDAPWGYDQKQTTHISADVPDVLGFKGTALIHDDSDVIGNIYPEVIIDVLSDTDIEIENKLAKTVTKIRNCVEGERITISNFSIESDECIPDDTGKTYDYIGRHKTLYDDFNYTWLPITNYFTPNNTRDSRVNEIEVTGNCRIILNWYSPRKAVV